MKGFKRVASMTDIVQEVSKLLHEKNLLLASAESCTGGWVAKKMTDLAGSSAIFDRAYVTYSNQAKQDMLGVAAITLDTYGAVSEQVVAEMVEGVLERSNVDIALSISGIAGPGGGSPEKPVGMVCFGWQLRGAEPQTDIQYFRGDRHAVRHQSVEHALKGVIKLLAGC